MAARNPFSAIATTFDKLGTQMQSLAQWYEQNQGQLGGIGARAGNKPGSTRGKARTGTTRRGRRANTAGKDAPASAA